MPRKSVDYSRTIIYKIQHEDDDELIYVGSTTDFTKRKYAHKQSSINPTNSKYNNKKYKIIRDNGGWSCFKMIEIKKYPCNDGNEACAEEDRIMQELKSTMNSNRAYTGLTKKEYNKQWSRERITCNCGCVVNKSSLLIHNKTKKHLERLEGLEG